MKNLIKAIAIMITMGMASTVYAADEGFQASIRILTALQISEQSALTFPDTEASATAQTVVVAPTDLGAATFNISGEPGEAVTSSIAEASLDLVNGSTTIRIDGFTLGGGVAADGTGTLTGGAINGAAVGATANIPANPEAGTYSGTLTFRVVYN